MTTTLRAVVDDVLALEDLLFESGGELTPEIEQWMAENEAHLSAKVDAYGTVLVEWKARIELLKGEETRLAAKRKTLENSTQRLKGWLCECMQRMDVKKVEGELFSVGRQNASQRALTILCTTENAPPEFVKPYSGVALDKDALVAAIGKPTSAESVELTVNGKLLARLEAPTQFVVFR